MLYRASRPCQDQFGPEKFLVPIKTSRHHHRHYCCLEYSAWDPSFLAYGAEDKHVDVAVMSAAKLLYSRTLPRFPSALSYRVNRMTWPYFSWLPLPLLRNEKDMLGHGRPMSQPLCH